VISAERVAELSPCRAGLAGANAPYTSSGVARFTNMLLSLWLSPWGKLIDLEVFVPSVPLLSLKGIHLAVFTAQALAALDAAFGGLRRGSEVASQPGTLPARARTGKLVGPG